ncbi:hypothetical protein [Paenibacillus sp. GCM10012303]
MTNIIIGSQPLDALDQADEKWKKDGGDKIIAEINEQYKKSK